MTTLRVVGALAPFFLWTLFWGLMCPVSQTFHSLLLKHFGCPHYGHKIPKIWMGPGHWWIFTVMLGVKQRLSCDVTPRTGVDFRLCVAQHPVLMGLLGFSVPITHDLGLVTAFVMKRELFTKLRYIPIWPIIWGLRVMGLAAVIDRKNPEKALATLRKIVERSHGRCLWILFADRHRPSLKALLADIKRFRELYPDIGDWLTESCMVTPIGVRAIIEGLEEAGFSYEVIEILSAYEARDRFADHVGTTQHIAIRDMTDEFETLLGDEAWFAWAADLTKRWNSTIRGLRKGD